MSLHQTLQVFELLDNARVIGADVVKLFAGYSAVDVTTRRVSGTKGYTDFIRVILPGSHGRSQEVMPLRWVLSVGWGDRRTSGAYWAGF